jgi:hypothetical protein
MKSIFRNKLVKTDENIRLPSPKAPNHSKQSTRQDDNGGEDRRQSAQSLNQIQGVSYTHSMTFYWYITRILEVADN